MTDEEYKQNREKVRNLPKCDLQGRSSDGRIRLIDHTTKEPLTGWCLNYDNARNSLRKQHGLKPI